MDEVEGPVRAGWFKVDGSKDVEGCVGICPPPGE